MTASAALRAALLLAACCMAFGKHLCGAFARLHSAARSHCGGLQEQTCARSPCRRGPRLVQV